MAILATLPFVVPNEKMAPIFTSLASLCSSEDCPIKQIRNTNTNHFKFMMIINALVTVERDKIDVNKVEIEQAKGNTILKMNLSCMIYEA